MSSQLTEDQIKEIISTAHSLFKEGVFSKSKVNLEKGIYYLLKTIREGFCYYDGECLFVGKLVNSWYTDDIHASDFLIYTKKESRGKGLAKKAAQEFIEWAKGKNAVSIKIARSSGINEESFNKMAKDLNLTKVGDIYHV